MNFLNNDKGVSEVIGALLIFLILVVVLGSIQVYEVPRWNKELERQNFDIVSAEFIDIKSDLEDVSSQFVPKTSVLHMGVKYPERFMLRNPGPAYGTLNTYPLNITVNITLSDSSGGNIIYNETKYTSMGIEYRLNGLSNFPKLVYEYGLIIKDFEVENVTDDVQSLLIEDEFFIPVVNRSSISLSSVETESLNLKPLEMSIFNTTNSTTGVEFNITRINITMDTKYNKTWNKIFNDTRVSVAGNKINISIPVSSKKYFVYPTATPYQDSIFFGMLKFTSNPNALKGLKGDKGDYGGGSGGEGCFYTNGSVKPECVAAVTVVGPTGPQGDPGGFYGVPQGPTGKNGSWINEAQSINRINIPNSSSMKKFIVDNITIANPPPTNDLYFKFSVYDNNGDFLTIKPTFDKNNISIFKSISLWNKSVNQQNGVEIIDTVTNQRLVSGGINITLYYKLSNIDIPNSLVMDEWNKGSQDDKKGILFIRTIICDDTKPC